MKIRQENKRSRRAGWLGCLERGSGAVVVAVLMQGMVGSWTGQAADWMPLFNGQDLNGWHTLPGGEWTVEEGAIVGKSAASERRHGLLVTDREFGDFEARLQFKVIEGDSGFYFRAEKVDGAVGVHGFQVEVDSSLETGGLYETGGRAWVVKPDPEKNAAHYTPGEWSRLRLVADGEEVTVFLNGHKTAELRDDPGRRRGHLALQLHGGQRMHVLYKDIEVRPLEDREDAP